jgi:hypothetical protein
LVIAPEFAPEAGCHGMQRGPIRTTAALPRDVERNLQARADARVDIPTEGAVPLTVAFERPPFLANQALFSPLRPPGRQLVHISPPHMGG